jgi:hypothetical protein
MIDKEFSRIFAFCPRVIAAGKDWLVYDDKRYWRGRQIISTDRWLKLSKANTASDIRDYNVQEGIKYIPETFVNSPWPLGVPNNLLQDTLKWRQDYFEYLEFIEDEEFRRYYYPTEEDKASDTNRQFGTEKDRQAKF